MNSNIAILFSKIHYYTFRLWFRVTKGKKMRDEIFKKKKITISTFIREGYYEGRGIKAYCRGNTDDFIHFFIRREEPVERHLELKRGQIFVDVGANVGYYSLKKYDRTNNETIRVIAIEAHPETFRALMKNIQINERASITAIQKAVSDHTGKVVMYDDYDIETGKFITGSSS
ncbi:MAG: FkbM family methyltransferase, partial [Nitrososphaera sp.]